MCHNLRICIPIPRPIAFDSYFRFVFLPRTIYPLRPKNPWKSVEIEITGVSKPRKYRRGSGNSRIFRPPLRFEKVYRQHRVSLASNPRNVTRLSIDYTIARLRTDTRGESAPFSPRPRIPRGIVRSNRLDSLSTRDILSRSCA